MLDRIRLGRVPRMALVAGSLALAVAAPAHAVTLTFDQSGPSGGTLAYGGEGGPLTGSGIGFDEITAGGVTLVCVDCTLSFVTGANTSEGPVYIWDGGGSFVLTGSAVDPGGDGVLGGGDDVVVAPVGTTLLAGQFQGPVVGAPGGGGIIISGSGLDTKNFDLLIYLGLDPNQGFIFQNTEIASSGFNPGGNGGFNVTVTEADITNTPVPEPGTLSLLAAGLVGAALVRRRVK